MAPASRMYRLPLATHAQGDESAPIGSSPDAAALPQRFAVTFRGHSLRAHHRARDSPARACRSRVERLVARSNVRAATAASSATTILRASPLPPATALG